MNTFKKNLRRKGQPELDILSKNMQKRTKDEILKRIT